MESDAGRGTDGARAPRSRTVSFGAFTIDLVEMEAIGPKASSSALEDWIRIHVGAATMKARLLASRAGTAGIPEKVMAEMANCGLAEAIEREMASARIPEEEEASAIEALREADDVLACLALIHSGKFDADDVARPVASMSEAERLGLIRAQDWCNRMEDLAPFVGALMEHAEWRRIFGGSAHAS